MHLIDTPTGTALEDLKDLLNERFDSLYLESSFPDFLSSFYTSTPALTEQILVIGDEALLGIQELNGLPLTKEYGPYYVIHFDWSQKAKNFLILWRNLFFEHQKAWLAHLDEAVSEQQLKELVSDSKSVMQSAISEFLDSAESLLEKRSKQKGGIEKQLDQWSHEVNPWPVYRNQIQELNKQIENIWQTYLVLDKAAEKINSIRKLVHYHTEQVDQKANQTEKQGRDIKAYLHEVDVEMWEASKVIQQLEVYESQLDFTPQSHAFTHDLEDLVAELPGKMSVPISLEGGMLLRKEVDIKRSTQYWIESEILPALYEIWEAGDNSSNRLKMALLNVKNRVKLLRSEEGESEARIVGAQIDHPILAYLNRSAEVQNQILPTIELIEKRMASRFSMYSIYDSKQSFLPVSIQASFNKVSINQNKSSESNQSWKEYQTRLIKRVKSVVDIDDSLSISERIVKFIRSKTLVTSQNAYNSIFSIHSYVGDSFRVGRVKELNHFESIKNQWDLGYRGAVLISGLRLAGKTIFGEMAANNYFGDKMIKLEPNQLISWQGRNIEVGFDIRPALEFIRKYSINQRPLIWIDDVELWHDPQVPLSQNIRTLQKFIDNYSNQMFFLVSSTNWVNEHLSKVFAWPKTFQAEINVDRMNLNEIQEAILIRQGASHKVIVDEDQNPITPTRFNTLTQRVYRSEHGNIGQILHQWALSIEMVDEDFVHFRSPSTVYMPDFIDDLDMSILLRTLLLSRQTNEYNLRKLFGPAFATRYNGLLQRLIGVGLLQRDLEGWLSFNEVAVNEVAKLLSTKNQLTFHRSTVN